MKEMTVMFSSMAMGLNTVSVAAKVKASEEQEIDILLIGGNIMSTTLGIYLHELEPKWSMTMVERLEDVTQESSDGWNNIGTGHSALMELDYTPQNVDGNISIEKTVAINEVFQISRQFWAHRVECGVLRTPRSLTNTAPHMNFVWGEGNINFLRARYAALQQSSLLRGMRYFEDHTQIKEWAPSVVEGRNLQQKVATMRTEIGIDVDYGGITRQLTTSLQKKSDFSLQLSSGVRTSEHNNNNTQTVIVADLKNGVAQNIRIELVFIGVGGAALKLLQESGISEAKDCVGFPVGGQFLVSENPNVVDRHLVKVYGRTSIGAPPVSAPHTDTYVLDGKRVVLFRPFATLLAKFLKNGSLWDLMGSTTTPNVMPMMHVGLDDFDLMKYLMGQAMLSGEDRFEALREYYPQAKREDWRLWRVGQHVQIIKRDAKEGDILRPDTEVTSDQQGTITMLLGTSLGASTTAPIMLNLLEKVFGDRVSSPQWQTALKTIIPPYGRKLDDDIMATKRGLQYTSEVLGLDYDRLQAADSTSEPRLKPQSVQKGIADIALQ